MWTASGPGWKVAECGPGGASWVGGEGLAAGHVQAEPVSLLALPPRGLSLARSAGHATLCGWSSGRGPEHAGQGVQAAGQGKRVRKPHPVQRPVGGAFRGVEVVMAVEV